jgi:hypothetical protein
VPFRTLLYYIVKTTIFYWTLNSKLYFSNALQTFIIIYFSHPAKKSVVHAKSSFVKTTQMCKTNRKFVKISQKKSEVHITHKLVPHTNRVYTKCVWLHHKNSRSAEYLYTLHYISEVKIVVPLVMVNPFSFRKKNEKKSLKKFVKVSIKTNASWCIVCTWKGKIITTGFLSHPSS